MKYLGESQLDDPRLTLRADGFHDTQDRLMYFRGVNIAANAKSPPFIPFEDTRWWDLLASWGFNMIRLTIFWEAIEPESGYYDQLYLDKVKMLADQASDRGTYVVLDMHQDLYSRWLSGDGAPAWTFPAGVDPENNDGFGGRFWGMAYIFSSDVRACYTNFFQSSQLKEHYKNAWLEVVKRAGNNPYVLGYDIMNEPSCGDIPNYAGQFENEFLMPFYEEVISAIRRVHPGATCFVEPHIMDMYTSKLGPPELDNLVYAPHLYNPVSNALWVDPLPENPIFDLLLMIHEEKAKCLHMPLFIGEFGIPWKTQPFYARDSAVNDALEALENSFISNAYWDYSVKDVDIWNEEDYSLIDKKGNPRGIGVNVRPYVRKLRGFPIRQGFNHQTKEYFLEFKSEPGLPSTIIYVPNSVQYPNGFKICTSDGYTDYNRDKEELSYFPSYDGYHRIILKPR